MRLARTPNSRRRNFLRRGLVFALLSFILTVIIVVPSRQAAQRLSLVGGLAIIVLVVALGVVADMLGVAAAAATEAPFHAMASRKIAGAREALRLVRNADQVSTLFADVMGDVAGTVSGAAAAAVVWRFFAVAADQLTPHRVVVDAVVVAFAASLTVGGKAACKELALRKSTDVLMVAGKIMWWIELYLPVTILEDAGGR